MSPSTATMTSNEAARGQNSSPRQPPEGHGALPRREMAHTNIGEQLLKDFAAKCAELASMIKPQAGGQTCRCSSPRRRNNTCLYKEGE
jgi:hypothetical protein